MHSQNQSNPVLETIRGAAHLTGIMRQFLIIPLPDEDPETGRPPDREPVEPGPPIEDPPPD